MAKLKNKMSMGGMDIDVTVERITDAPPAYKITAVSGEHTYEMVHTVSPVDGQVEIPSLADLQAAIDHARQICAKHVALRATVIGQLEPQLI